MKKLIVCATLVILSTVLSSPLGMAFAASSAAPIKLGCPTSLGFSEGKGALRGAQMAVDEINQKGGVSVGGVKRTLKLMPLDIRDAAPGVPVQEALLGIEKLILQQKVDAIVVGPFRSEALLASMDLIAKYKIPMLNTIAMTPKFNAKIKQNPEKYKYCFRVCLTSIDFVRLLMGGCGYLKSEYGLNKAFIMNQDVLWCNATVAGLKKYFKKTGWELLGHEVYPTGNTQFSQGLLKVQQKKAQILFVVSDMPQMGIMVKEWIAMNKPALMIGYMRPLEGPSGWQIFGGKIAGVISTIAELGELPSQKYPPSVEFYENFEKRWGEIVQASHGVSPSYDSVYIYAEAVERAGSLDPDKVVAEMKKTNRMGVIGKIVFDESNQVLYGKNPFQAAVAALFQWQEDGTRALVYPESVADAKIEMPAWAKR